MPSRGVSARARWIDGAVLAAVVLGCLAFGWVAVSQFNYDWDWGRAWSYMWTPNAELGGLSFFVFGLVNTLKVALAAAILGFVIGAFVGLMRVSRQRFWRGLGGAYVTLIRNMPPLVFIFIFYFFVTPLLMPLLPMEVLKSWLLGAEWREVVFIQSSLMENFFAAVVSLSVLEGAFVAEIVRGGFQSIPRGQVEAAQSLGLKRLDVLCFVQVPQVLALIVPQLGNVLVSIIKNTAIVSLISVQELTFAAQEMANSSGRVFEIWLAAAGLYWLICFVTAAVLQRVLGQSRDQGLTSMA